MLPVHFLTSLVSSHRLSIALLDIIGGNIGIFHHKIGFIGMFCRANIGFYRAFVPIFDMIGTVNHATTRPIWAVGPCLQNSQL